MNKSRYILKDVSNYYKNSPKTHKSIKYLVYLIIVAIGIISLLTLKHIEKYKTQTNLATNTIKPIASNTWLYKNALLLSNADNYMQCTNLNIINWLQNFSKYSYLLSPTILNDKNNVYNLKNYLQILNIINTNIPTISKNKILIQICPYFAILSQHNININMNRTYTTNKTNISNYFIKIIISYQKKQKPQKIIQTTEDLPFGKSKIIQNGISGIYNIKQEFLLFANNSILLNKNKEVIQKSKAYIILTGASPQYRTINIDGQTIRYFRKLHVWATSYDSNCAGCNNITATGKTLQYGIIAVDPNVIPLHSCIYVPGYGFGQAEDTGGAIKGNKIDLAFKDVQYGWWSARYTDIYIVDCSDAKLPWNK